jgi:ubiquinone/menaquinone biosynthesis C-methylase UbiE
MSSETKETFQLTQDMAEAYERHFVPAFFAQWAPQLVEAAGVRPGQRVLDVACGTGIVARTAAPRVGTAGSVTGVDINEAMLSVARRVSPDLEWRQGDAAALPFEDAGFDVVLSQMAMMFFPDPAAALREMARVVQPPGTVAILIPAGLDANPAYEAFVDIVTRHAGPAARNLVTTYFVLGDLDRTVDLFTAAGLRVTHRSSPSGQSRYGSLDEAINIEIDSTPLGDGLDPAIRERILADCREAWSPLVTASNAADSDHAAAGVAFTFRSHIVVAER